MTDLLFSQPVLHGILGVFLSGVAVSVLSGVVSSDRQINGGLLIGHMAALGFLAGSIVGWTQTFAASLTALLAVGGCILLARMARNRHPEPLPRLFLAGFLLAAGGLAIAAWQAGFRHPGIEELLFGRLLAVSMDELITVAIAVGVTMVVRAALSRSPLGEDRREQISLIGLAAISGWLLPVVGALPMTGLITLSGFAGSSNSLPESSTQSRASTIVLLSVSLLVIAVSGILLAARYGVDPGGSILASMAVVMALMVLAGIGKRA